VEGAGPGDTESNRESDTAVKEAVASGDELRATTKEMGETSPVFD
jgi:hypothetical protein